MNSILVAQENILLKKKIPFSVTGSDWESLLVNWLNEILYHIFVKKMGCSKFKIEKISPFKIKGLFWGEYLDLKRHEVYKEIKAVTYHRLKIRKNKNGYTTKIIFDI